MRRTQTRKELLAKVVQMADTLAYKSKYLVKNTSIREYDDGLRIHFRHESLATGLAGLVWALQDASDVLKVNRYDAPIRFTIDRLIEDYNNRDNHNYGLLNGYGGVALTLARSYDRTGNPDHLRQAIEIGIDSCDRFIDSSDIPNNYFHGRAGMLMAMLYTFHVSGDQSLIWVIEEYVHKILSQAYDSGDVLYFDDPRATTHDSFAFGRAGVGFVFNELSRYFGCPSFRHVANRALLPSVNEEFQGASWLYGSSGVLAVRSIRAGLRSSKLDFAFPEVEIKNQRVDGVLDVAGTLSALQYFNLDINNFRSRLLEILNNKKEFDGMSGSFSDGMAGLLHLASKCLNKKALSPILPFALGKAKVGFNLSTTGAKKLMLQRFFSRSILALTEKVGQTKAVNTAVRFSRQKVQHPIHGLLQDEKDMLALDILVFNTFWKFQHERAFEKNRRNAADALRRFRKSHLLNCQLKINPGLKLFIPRRTQSYLRRFLKPSKSINLEEAFSEAYMVGSLVHSETVCKNIGLLVVVLRVFTKPIRLREAVEQITTTLLLQHDGTREQLQSICEVQPDETLESVLPKVVENIIFEFINLYYLTKSKAG